ncbi:hypothetical protein IFR04_016292 [Cadophora malorum]|uniref:Major facilitator superfamily (MFS) profile domain-containing protein n=1 Tax=Cadophora malorum TaxID=108018 RepID=A0A8H7T187_9HELO|nr:hypothetical protein IFR04_016292 [Cadophora malorum]
MANNEKDFEMQPNTEAIEHLDKPQVQASRHDQDIDEKYTHKEQRKIIHKVDRRLLIVLGLMQAVSFLDRANISNANIAGMEEELGLGIGTRYSIVLLVFFGPYILLQFPATLAIRKIGPRVFLSTIVLIWGVVMICFGFVHDWKALTALRILLGALEAGCFPGQYYLLSMWYSRYDMHKRFSIWYLIGVLGSAFGGIFALLFTQMAGLAGYGAWRWIFIMEGIITCLIGILGYIFMVDFPERAHTAWSFLSKDEADYIIRRINRDRQDAEGDKFSWTKFLTPALDFKVWVFALMFFCATIGAYSVGFYLPLILKGELGFSTEISQVLSSPPYLFANVVMFLEGWVCDKYRIRGPCVIFNSSMSVVGLCLMAYTKVPGSQYLGVLLVTAGCSANIPAVMVYQANNIRGSWKRAFCSASLISFGGTGGIAGSLVFRSQDAPKYLPGIYATIT